MPRPRGLPLKRNFFLNLARIWRPFGSPRNLDPLLKWGQNAAAAAAGSVAAVAVVDSAVAVAADVGAAGGPD